MDSINADKKIEELQHLESHLQNFLMQKQAVQIELNEIDNALREIKNSSDELYKMVSGVMIKSTKEKLNKELEEKKKIAEMKLASIEKEEKKPREKLSDPKKRNSRIKEERETIVDTISIIFIYSFSGGISWLSTSRDSSEKGQRMNTSKSI